MNHSYYALDNDAWYIQKRKDEAICRENKKMEEYAKIAKLTGFKYTGYIYHARSIDAIRHDVFIKHDDNGYHFAYQDYHKLKIILSNQKELLKMYKVGEGEIYSKF